METPEFTLNQLVAIREALATVIDDGCQKHWGQAWLLNAEDEDLANDERMRFADAVQAILTTNVRTQIETEAGK